MSEAPLTLGDFAEMELGRLTGVGEMKLKALNAVGVKTVLDLLTYYPRRWIDRTKEARIADLAEGEEAMVVVEVRSTTSRRMRNGKPMVVVEVADATGRLKVTFFNQAWRERQLYRGLQIALFGKLEVFRGTRQMANPVVDLIGDKTGRVVPIYPQSEKAGLSTWEIGGWVEQVLRRSATRGIADPIPQAVLDRVDVIDRQAALKGIHAPESMDEKDAARTRLVFDELFRIQLALVLRKQAYERTARGIRHDTSGTLVERFVERLPFELTAPQRDAMAEIARDLAGPHPMHRLLQGDVGSGKTVVGVAAMLTAVQGGHQGAIMAPTAVLAEQHTMGIRQLLDGVTVGGGSDAGMLFDERPLGVELLTNRTTAKERERLLAGLADGLVDIVIGTHALLEEGIRFKSLGVVVIDEQHRFGVEQRAALRDKGSDGTVPDVLVMTATPIPRSAAMTVYGDLDVTVIAGKPPGRQSITTVWERSADAVWPHVLEQVAAGHQAYVVTPLIEESEKLDVRSAETTHAELEAGPLAGLRLGLLHGRVKAAEKEATMQRFRDRELDVLVATTVIEVGVDVPNATVMVVLDADRFGIAQLHQLRGRVGRGADASWCYLVGEATTPDGERRLQAMVDSDDGFLLAEVDLEVRGEGTVFDTRQKGRSDLKLASLLRDRPVVERARVAFELVGADPGLDDHRELLDEIELFLDDDEKAFLEKG